jgi:hypothetical protein
VLCSKESKQLIPEEKKRTVPPSSFFAQWITEFFDISRAVRADFYIKDVPTAFYILGV